MHDIEQTETINFKHCQVCSADLLDRDRFCRRCGSPQLRSHTATTGLTDLTNYETRLLNGPTRGYQSYSGQLIRVITESLSERTDIQSPSRGLRRLVCTLITIPIWMLIVMLAPLDAYSAARAATERGIGR